MVCEQQRRGRFLAGKDSIIVAQTGKRLNYLKYKFMYINILLTGLLGC